MIKKKRTEVNKKNMTIPILTNDIASMNIKDNRTFEDNNSFQR